MTKKQLTPEQEKLQEEVRKKAEENGLSRKEVEELENLAGVIGGMSENAKRILIGSTIALGGAALGAAALYGGQRLNKWHKERNEKPATTNTNTNTNTSTNTIPDLALVPVPGTNPPATATIPPSPDNTLAVATIPPSPDDVD